MTVGAVALMAVLACGLLALSGWALYDRFEQTNARRAQQATFNQRVRQVSIEYCREIEALKEAQRSEAVESYRNLDRNLALLRIERTDEIVAVAKQSRDGQLDRFKREPCPRPQQKDDE